VDALPGKEADDKKGDPGNFITQVSGVIFENYFKSFELSNIFVTEKPT
jgi:hypothetical protein